MKKILIKLLGGYTAKEVQEIRAYYRGMLRAMAKEAKVSKKSRLRGFQSEAISPTEI